ncbi:hypothetical protein [Mycolicibacterium wolinskyi]|uniref:hypothetical protein n=1 Tax=Mycolicibacterium wolinskyi TaxID=59750 RepID=UPI0039179210
MTDRDSIGFPWAIDAVEQFVPKRDRDWYCDEIDKAAADLKGGLGALFGAVGMDPNPGYRAVADSLRDIADAVDGSRPVSLDDLSAHLLAEAHAAGWAQVDDLVELFARSLRADFRITKSPNR